MHLIPLVSLVLLAMAQPGPTPAPGASRLLTGTVVDSEGKAVAGIEVLLSSGLPPSGERPLIGWSVLGMSNTLDPVAEPRSVLGRCRTDDGGRFRIDLPAEIVRSQEPLPVALWAYRAGGRVASQRLPWASPAPAEPVRLVLGTAAASRFRILGPDGTPDAGARVVVTALDRLVVPEDFAGLVGARAGPDGVAVVSAFAPGEIGRVRVESPRSGTQTVRVDGQDAAGPKTITLAAAGRVSGRVLTRDSKPVSGLKVRAQTFPGGVDTGGPIGSAEVATDESGRFELPAIAAGRLALVLDFRARPDLPYRGLPPANQVVEAGQTTTIEVRLKRAVRIEGVVRERGTGVPIAGASPQIPDLAFRRGGNPKVVTDALGRFAGYMEGQQPYAFLHETPKPYFIPSDAPDTFHLLPAGATAFVLPPTELVRGAELGGTVVDETSKLVAGALVRASWGGKNTVLQSVAARTDPSGTFRLDGLDPLADLRLTAESNGLATAAPQSARAGADKPVKLVVSRANTVVLAGRVVDTAGKPVERAEVRIRSQTRTTEGQVWRIEPVGFDDRNALRTDAEGRFRTPDGVAYGVEYEASIRSQGMLPSQTVWLKPSRGEKAVFADVTLRRLRTVEGVVHDRKGRPVEGAIVFQSGDGPIRTRTITDLKGHFQLSGVIEGKAILFARKNGFRLQGQPIDTEAGAAKVELTRSDETPIPLATLASVLPRHDELALAQRLLAPYVDQVMLKGNDREKFQILASMAPIDPSRVLELIETKGTGKPLFALDSLRTLVAAGLAGESPDEAVSVAVTIQDPGARSWCLTDVFDKLPASARARKVELLAQAQLQASGIKQLAEKLRLLGRIADRWLDLGETERAMALLREGRALAKQVPPPGYEIVAFAEPLARVDLPAALALIDVARDSAKRGDRVNRVFIFDRSYGEIAYRLASRDPAGVERVLALIDDSYRRSGFAVAACSRMATTDLPRARRIAETIDDPLQRAYALGLMARVLAAADKSAAAQLLEQAFNQLEENQYDQQSDSVPASVAAVLLQAVERVDPARLQESVWRALALRPPRLDGRGETANGRAAAELALNIARYDRAAAAAVLAPAIAAFSTTDVDTLRQGIIAMALVLIDPRRAVALVEAMPDDPGLDPSLPKNAARKWSAEMLGKHGDARWRTVRQWGISLWRPEGSDL
jgi:Carboxypeptidase regulatory-like domain